MTEKDFRLVPCGDKSLGISPQREPENEREEQHAELRGLFLLTMKRKLFFFLRRHPTFLLHVTKNILRGGRNVISLVLQESTFIVDILALFFCCPNQLYCMLHEVLCNLLPMKKITAARLNEYFAFYMGMCTLPF